MTWLHWAYRGALLVLLVTIVYLLTEIEGHLDWISTQLISIETTIER